MESLPSLGASSFVTATPPPSSVKQSRPTSTVAPSVLPPSSSAGSRSKMFEKLEVACQLLERDGDLLTALDQRWRVLELKRKTFGEGPEVQEETLRVVELNNAIAASFSEQNRKLDAVKYLRAADSLTEIPLADPDLESRRLLAQAKTLNHWTCIKKSQGDVRGALKVTEKALSILLHLQLLDQLPTCYLNICALYSALGLHAEALQHAYLALQVVKELVAAQDAGTNLAGPTPMPGTASQPSTKRRSPSPVVVPPSRSPSPTAVAAIPIELPSAASQPYALAAQLAICYYNIAVEQEYLLDPTFVQTYELALLTAEDRLGPDHVLCHKFRKTYRKAVKDLAKLARDPNSPEYQHHLQRLGYGATTTTSVSAMYASQLKSKKGVRLPQNAARARP
eukprot:TRINITY_DN12086_c0_g1_i1.p1 TRINITY_DN12086_c0_g1~~TRINITY_DN12086_c0_g1_i1.p1  ORF type:complete len:395 (+),score=67.20 TRINITY_DN12086_c0_g1_i1:968-2152(+)